MSIPVTTQLFDAFLGTQEGIHSIALPDIFSSGGSKNLYIDKYARAKKILGYTKQNSTPVNLTGSTAMTAVLPYRKTSGGSVSRQVIGCFDNGTSVELYHSADTGATWTNLSAGLSGVTGIPPDAAQFGDNLYMTFGGDSPLKWDGTSLTAVGRTQSPTPSSSAGSDGLLNGTYKWKLVMVNSSGVRQAASASSAVLTITDKQASLTWTATGDTSIVGYEVYRTTGTGTVFYFVDYVNGRATAAYTDNSSDLTILENRVMAEHGDPPPTTYYCEPHKQRMWWARTSTYPTRAYWSDPGLPEDVWGDNYLDFSDSETVGDQIVGMVGNVEGKLVVLTERAIWTVSGTGQVIGNIVDWTRIRTNAQTGCVTHRAAAKVPAGAKYTDQKGKEQLTNVVTLAYLTPMNDIRVFDGDNDVIISNPMKNTLADFNFSARSKAFCVTDQPRREISWVFPSGSSGSPDQAVVWNYGWGVWYTRDWAFSHAVEMETSSDASILLAGSNALSGGAYCYLLWNGNSFDSAAIEAVWMTKTLYGLNQQAQPAMSNLKRWRWVDFLFETEQTATLTVEWLTGNAPDNGSSEGSVQLSPDASALLTSDGDRLTTVSGDVIVVSQQSTNLRTPLKNSSGEYLHDEGMRLRVGDNASNGSWSIEAMTLAYQILPGQERRMP